MSEPIIADDQVRRHSGHHAGSNQNYQIIVMISPTEANVIKTPPGHRQCRVQCSVTPQSQRLMDQELGLHWSKIQEPLN